jgi:hypothetical protein
VFILSEQPRPRGGKGLEIRHYLAETRKLEIHEFQTDVVKNAQEEGPLRLLFGIKPETAHARYAFKIEERTAESVTVRITPKLEQDRQEFLEAILTLDSKSFMPKRLRVRENADTDVTYDFSRIYTNVDTPDLEIELSVFEPLKIKEREWQVTREQHGPDRAAAQDRPRRPGQP